MNPCTEATIEAAAEVQRCQIESSLRHQHTRQSMIEEIVRLRPNISRHTLRGLDNIEIRQFWRHCITTFAEV